jgi:hypothetical protein
VNVSLLKIPKFSPAIFDKIPPLYTTVLKIDGIFN